MNKIALVVCSDYDIYDIYGVFSSQEVAISALEEAGFCTDKQGKKAGLWCKRNWMWGLQIDEYPVGWGDDFKEEDALPS